MGERPAAVARPRSPQFPARVSAFVHGERRPGKQTLNTPPDHPWQRTDMYRRENKRGRALTAIAVAMAAVMVGAFAVQYYTWTIPTVVKPLTFTFTEDTRNNCGACTGGDTYGTAPTASVATVAAAEGAEKAEIYVAAVGTAAENIKIVARVEAAACTTLATGYDNLIVYIDIYVKGDNSSTPKVDTLILDLVQDGSATTGNVVEDTSVTLDVAEDYACVIRTVFETIETESTVSALDIPIKIRATEDSLL